MVKIPSFKGNFCPDGQKMQKNFNLKNFSDTFKEFLEVKTLKGGGRKIKLFEVLKPVFPNI